MQSVARLRCRRMRPTASRQRPAWSSDSSISRMPSTNVESLSEILVMKCPASVGSSVICASISARVMRKARTRVRATIVDVHSVSMIMVISASSDPTGTISGSAPRPGPLIRCASPEITSTAASLPLVLADDDIARIVDNAIGAARDLGDLQRLQPLKQGTLQSGRTSASIAIDLTPQT